MSNDKLNNVFDNAFWQYACKLYQKPALEKTLLQLQDEHGLSVIILLLMAWLGEKQVSLNQDSLKILIDCTSEIDCHVMQPLRHARQFIKTEKSLAPIYYEQLKRLEITIEQQLMQRLYNKSLILLDDIVNQPSVEHNVSLYINNHASFITSQIQLTKLMISKETLLKVLLE